MMDNNTADLLRIAGLCGLLISVSVWGLAELSRGRKVILSLAACASLVSAVIYFVGVMAAADSGAHRFFPRFP